LAGYTQSRNGRRRISSVVIKESTVADLSRVPLYCYQRSTSLLQFRLLVRFIIGTTVRRIGQDQNVSFAFARWTDIEGYLGIKTPKEVWGDNNNNLIVIYLFTCYEQLERPLYSTSFFCTINTTQQNHKNISHEQNQSCDTTQSNLQ